MTKFCRCDDNVPKNYATVLLMQEMQRDQQISRKNFNMSCCIPYKKMRKIILLVINFRSKGSLNKIINKRMMSSKGPHFTLGLTHQIIIIQRHNRNVLKPFSFSCSFIKCFSFWLLDWSHKSEYCFVLEIFVLCSFLIKFFQFVYSFCQ